MDDTSGGEGRSAEGFRATWSTAWDLEETSFAAVGCCVRFRLPLCSSSMISAAEPTCTSVMPGAGMMQRE